MKNKITVAVLSHTVTAFRTIEIKEGTVIKTLTCGDAVFMRVTKATEVVGRIPDKEDSKHSEAAIASFVQNDDEVVGLAGSKFDKPFIYAEKAVEYKTVIELIPGTQVRYFVLADYKENQNSTYSLKDGSKWIEVELL